MLRPPIQPPCDRQLATGSLLEHRVQRLQRPGANRSLDREDARRSRCGRRDLTYVAAGIGAGMNSVLPDLGAGAAYAQTEEKAIAVEKNSQCPRFDSNKKWSTGSGLPPEGDPVS